MSERSGASLRIFARAALAAALWAGCLPSVSYEPRPLENVAIPVEDTTPKPRAAQERRESPPESGPARPFGLPGVAWAELPSGVRVGTATSRALPLVAIRVVVPGGSAADGDRAGVAALTGELLQDGGAGGLSSRELSTRVESLGATLSIQTGRDAIVIGADVTRDHLDEALGLLGLIVQKPRLDGAELEKLKKRAMEQAADDARTNGRWGAMRVMFRELYALPSGRHPYAVPGATRDEIAKITADDCRAFHGRWFLPRNTLVIVAGDTTPDAAKAAVEKAFGDRRAGERPVIPFPDPAPPEALEITVVDRPKSSQSDVFVGTLGPKRSDPAWPAFAAAAQVLGGVGSGRLFRDVREQQSLAYTTNAYPIEVARGPVPLVAYAGTQTPKTGLAVKALLDHLARFAAAPPEQAEVDVATRFLADVLALRLETMGAVADEVVRLRLLGLPDDYHDHYRKEVREVTPALAGKLAAEHVRPGRAVVVVAGDAGVIAPMLSHFGDVKVVDPTRNFEQLRALPRDPGAALEAAPGGG